MLERPPVPNDDINITQDQATGLAERAKREVRPGPNVAAPSDVERIDWAIANIDSGYYNWMTEAQKEATKSELWRQRSFLTRPRGKQSLSLKGRLPGRGTAAPASSAGGFQVGQTVMYQGKPHIFKGMESAGKAILEAQ